MGFCVDWFKNITYMKIALDAMGGDKAPLVNIEGAREALALYPQIEKIYLVGDEAEMHESGAKTLRSKRDSSISVAAGLVKKGEADALVSAGNTGAAVAAATLKLRTLKGVERAGIAGCNVCKACLWSERPYSGSDVEW